MIGLEEEHGTLNGEPLQDAVLSRGPFSQSEALVLGAGNGCFFPTSLSDPARTTGAGDARPASAGRLVRMAL